MDTHYSIIAWRIPWTQTTVHGVIKSQTQLCVSDFHFHFPAQPGSLSSDLGQPQNSAYRPAQLGNDVNTALPWSTASSLMGLFDTYPPKRKAPPQTYQLRQLLKTYQQNPDQMVSLVNCLLVLLLFYFCSSFLV